jgi:XTP/dITP diphosphohydrolase
MTPLILATGNRHKIAEFQLLDRLHPCGLRLQGAEAAGGMPSVDENAGTFLGNARLKAAALRARAPGDAWVMADDSGLCVDALAGAPGVRSARYAGAGAGDRANLRKLVDVMQGIEPELRTARFVCVLVALAPDGREIAAEGRCEGRLALEPAGIGGFGYDPLFVPDGEQGSFAELGDAIKNRISHRSRAWRAWIVRSGGRP